MKRSGFLILWAVLIFVLTACQLTNPSTNNPLPTTTQPSHNINTLDNAQKISEGMTLGQVKDLVGSNCCDVGSGAIIYQWELTNGQYLLVHFNNLRTDAQELDISLIATNVKIENEPRILG